MVAQVHPDFVDAIMKSNSPDNTLDVIVTLTELNDKNVANLKKMGFIPCSQYHNINALAAKIKTYNKGEKWLKKLVNLNYIRKVSIAYDVETLAG